MNDLLGYFDQLRAVWRGAERWAAFWTPSIEVPLGLNPLATIGSLLALAITAGIAIGALASLVASLFALYLLLTQLFGLRFELALS